MYADFCRKIDVWKIFLQRLNIEDALQQNIEPTMSLSSKKHFPALYLFWKPPFWCLQIFNFQKPWELPKIAYFLSINLFFCLTIELLHTTMHKSHSLDLKLVLLLIHNAHSRSNKQFQNANNRTNKEKFLQKNRGFYEDFHIDINYVDLIFLFGWIL